MDYTEISKEIKKYVRKSTYIAMNKEERKLYLKAVKRLAHKLDELDESSSTSSDEVIKPQRKEYTKPVYRKLNSRSINFVGMRFHGDHRFSCDDTIKLKKEDNNPKDSNAIKVMLMKDKKWKHVAYVAREDAMWLRTVDEFEKLSLKWEKDTRATATYSIDLRPLEEKGVKLKTKKDVLGHRFGYLERRGLYWYSDTEEWV
ncbi:hypothetical protein MVEG_12412 [Podila verticillata NRRL 6337]|uniref:HIRAN domain-containing protein n=1 Tax=Podila verticillata NRRL 6337 TaxID=1069443 RepID=A0A086TIH5_9FUNG|nr:hypothetical protein MVEG_12412 [Podila verticillata NRRL 6337]